jgi:hypothetical protein
MKTLPVWQFTPYCSLHTLAGILVLGGALSACGDDVGGGRDTSRGAAAGDVDGDGQIDYRSAVIDAPDEVRRALCSSETAELDFDKLTRGSWQFNPGGGFMELPEAGYPCKAFLYDEMRPEPSDKRWTDAADADFVGFSETSTISAAGYMTAQFRYFRTLLFVPEGKRPAALTVKVTGIDDALYLAVYNSKYPEGVSPTDAGPSEEDVGACSGNGHADWDLTGYIEPGEVNTLLLVHADMSPATSSLDSVEVEADGLPIQMVSCEGG